MKPSQILTFLNAIHVGEIGGIAAKLAEAESACQDLGLDDLAGRLEAARGALGRGDLKSFRKGVETVVSKLGHLK